ncbi:hypothetical protein [Amycolatopsis suaedae]|uniref:Uncharacterized protein n=1 Tax=Amycolatopsis suaedae TaxID=2510978 RepID=A0A4Q7JE50_9PSEU|nr:hypothetical protein [Amycolatopsis suaedae]RZQ64943.1 hypothetical protein EWH70_03240 [Amycolatopsis suaedae]
MAATPGRTAVTGGANGTRSLPTRVVPPLELPGKPEALAAEAAAALGWEGHLLPEMTMLGRKVFVVARLRTDVHAERIAMGVGPTLDRATVDTWTWPELAGTAPAPAAEISGVIAVARHWRTGMASTVPFVRYGNAAMVLPMAAVMTEDYVANCLPRARIYGLGVLTAHDTGMVDTDLAIRSERMVLGEDAVSRWVNEAVYEQLLVAQDTAANAS